MSRVLPLTAPFHRRVVLLAAGDLAVLLLFAAIGRANHGEPLTVSSTISTAMPFIIGENPVLIPAAGANDGSSSDAAVGPFILPHPAGRRR